jgi:hypothetical protein
MGIQVDGVLVGAGSLYDNKYLPSMYPFSDAFPNTKLPLSRLSDHQTKETHVPHENEYTCVMMAYYAETSTCIWWKP